jgi:DNA polymerase-3 subunit alpha
MTKRKADQLWKLIEPFAAYGFNKAHAASYGRVAYQTAYVKANFPAIYMSSVLSAESGDVEKIAEIIGECKRMKIPILPPDINESFSQFTVIKGEDNIIEDRIRFGLITIKNFGQGIATAIISERRKNGKFKNLSDFLDRVKDKNLNKKSLEALIKSGAMDSLNIDRGILLGNIETILEYNKEKGKQSDNQDSLFGLMSDQSTVPTLRLRDDIPKASLQDRLSWEKELLGLYISGHPLDPYREIIQKRDIDIKKALENKKEGESVVIAMIIDEIRTTQTKNNETMAFLKVSDFTGSAPAVIFPKAYREFRSLIEPDSCIAVKCTIYIRNGEKGFVFERARKL